VTAAQGSAVIIIPGLRDPVEAHWQTLLERELPRVHAVPAMGRTDLDCQRRVQAIEEVIGKLAGPVLMVAHSGGCITVAHWAQITASAHKVRGCLLATPADLECPLPEGYPPMDLLRAGGWLPVPKERLPFRTLVAASRNDPLGSFDRIRTLAGNWGSDFEDLGEVGHLNPASGFGPWPQALSLLERLEESAPP